MNDGTGSVQESEASAAPESGEAAGGRAPFWHSWAWYLIGFALLVVVLWQVGPGELIRALLRIRPSYMGAALLLGVAMMLLRGMRWWLVCRGLGLSVGSGEALRLYLLSAFAGAATPGRVGDLAKAYSVRDRRAAGGLEAGVASVIYDRLLDIGQLGALALGAVDALPWPPGRWGPLLAVVGLAGLVAATLTGPIRKGLVAQPLAWALRRLPGGDGVAPGPMPGTTTLAAQGLTTAALSCFVGEVVILARGLGIDGPSWWQIAVLAALGALVGSLPISIFGIGTRDALFVAASPLLGVPAESLLALSVLMLAVYGFNAALGWAAWTATSPGARPGPS